jgi:uncharacterized protein YacL (UPF0231 family)
MGHEVIGRWLEQEIYTDSESIKSLLDVIERVKTEKRQEYSHLGKEISLSISRDEVTVQENALANQGDSLQESEFDYYDCESDAGCGLEDFEQLIRSWCDFIGYQK